VYTYTQSSLDNSWVLTGTPLTGSGGIGDFGAGLAISSDGSTLAVGEPVAGAVWVYTAIPATGLWTFQRKILHTDVPVGFAAGTYFGQSCALSSDGNTLVVGAMGHLTSKGGVAVFGRSGTTWTSQSGILAPGSAFGLLGQKLAINAAGDRVAVSAPDDTAQSPGKGAVYILTRSGSMVWSVRQQVLPSDSLLQSVRAFGSGIAMDAAGDTLIVGAQGEGLPQWTGAWWHFEWNSGTMQYEQVGTKKVPVGAAHMNQVGRAVALSADGQTLAGSTTDDHSIACGWRIGFCCRSR
jgi:hypothetical protein